MSSPERSGDLEREVTAVLERRAATIQRAPAYALRPPSRWPHRSGPARRRFGRHHAFAVAVAALLVLAVLGSVVAVAIAGRSSGSSRSAVPRPAPLGAACTAALPQSWRDVLSAAGPLSQDRIDTVLSAAADGSVLTESADPAGRAVLTLFTPGRLAQLVPVPAGTTAGAVVADPSAAISSAWVVIGLAGRPGLGPREVLAYNRDTRGEVKYQVATRSGVPLVDVAPIVISDHSAYWVENGASGTAQEQLTWALIFGYQAGTAQSPVRNVEQLMSISGDPSWIARGPDGASEVGTGAPEIPPNVLSATHGGRSIRSDRSSLTWVNTAGGRSLLSTWIPGSPRISQRNLPWADPVATAFGPFVAPVDAGRGLAPSSEILDTRSGALVNLGPDVGLLHAGTDNALFVVNGHTRSYVQVALSKLRPAAC